MAVAFVQKVAAGNGTGSAVLVLTVGASVTTTAGHMLSLAGRSGNGATVTGVTDSRGNTWQVDVPGISTTTCVSLASCIIAGGGALVTGDTITVTFSASATLYGACAEFSGVLASAGQPVPDRTNVVHSGTTSVTCATLGTAAAGGELVVSAAGGSGTATTFTITTPDPDSSGTWHDLAWPSPPSLLDMAWQVGGVSAGLFSAGWTGAGTGTNSEAAICTYKPGSAPTITTTSLPDGVKGQSYTAQLVVTGDLPPDTWSVSAGALPPGLTMTAGGGGGAGEPSGMGATVFLTGQQPRLADADTFDAFFGSNAAGPRTPARNAQKSYFEDVNNPGKHWQTSANSPQPLGQLAAAGVYQLPCWKPDLAGLNPDGTLNAAGKAEGVALYNSVALCQALPGFTGQHVLWQEWNNFTKSPFTSATQYVAWFRAYAPYIIAAGGKAAYCPLILTQTGTNPVDGYPGPVPAATLPAPYGDVPGQALVDCFPDWYCAGHFDNTLYTSGNTKGNLTFMVNLVTTGAAAGAGLGLGEIGVASGPNAPSQAEFANYMKDIAETMNALPAGQARYVCWYDADAAVGLNTIPTPASLGWDTVPYIKTLYDAVFTGTVAGGTSSTAGGAIRGTPTAGGLYSFTAKVTDSTTAFGTQPLTINITAPAALNIATTSLPAATAGVPYSATVTAGGGTPPVTFSLTGTLPDGLTFHGGLLNPSLAGLINGTPTAVAATSGFTVTATDAAGATDTQALFITVLPAAAAVTYPATYDPTYGTSVAPPPVPAPAPAGFPQVIIEAGLDPAMPAVPAGTFILDDPVHGKLSSNQKLGDATGWTDIAAFFRSGSIARPSTRVQGPLLTYEGGTATAAFDNADGRFDPDNPSGPYYGALRPMIPVRIRALWGPASYSIWAGFVTSWQGADLGYDMGYDEAQLAADDGFRILSGITIPGDQTAVFGDGETSGARVARILDAASWYTDHRRIAAGDSTVQGTAFGTDALSLLRLTADTEIGELYIDGAGNLTFRNRHAAITEARSTQVQAVFGDLPGTVHGSLTELACNPSGRADDDTTLANDIQATSVGGTRQRAQDKASQRTYLFPRSYARDDLLLESDPETLGWAQWVLTVSLSEEDRTDTVTIDPLADPAGLFPQVLGREIGDRIQIWRRPQNSGTVITQDCFIRGIQHDVDAVAGTWSTTWTLQKAIRYTGFLILDDPANGLLGTGKLAF